MEEELTPLETTTETEESGKMSAKPSGEGNVDRPFKKLTIHNDVDVISQSKSGGGSCSSERANEAEQQDTVAINQRTEYPKTKIARVGEFQRLVHYLFQMKLTQRDVEHGRLSIPFQTAELLFRSTNLVSNYEYQILISDNRNDNWYMTLTYNAEESTAFKFTITSGWQEFVDWHGLKSMDVIHFYKPIPRLHTKHYLIDYAKAERNVVSPFNVLMKPGRDDEARHDVITESKFGGSCSSERANQELQDNTDAQFHKIVFLFELQLTPSDIEHGLLYIPEKRAAKHFPPILTDPPNYNYEHQIEISDTQNQNWNMTLVYNSLLSAFIITRGWHRFVVRHGLEVMDVICFYIPLSRLHNWHFLIQHGKSGEVEKYNPPEFKPENFLFELQMNSTSCYFLILPKEEVRNHFPAIKIPGGRRMHFTDAQNKDWSMTIFFAQDCDAYILMDEWEGFVNKHRLEAMDVIRFYKPVQPLFEGHFLIECVKREETASGITTSPNDQLNGAENDGNGGRPWR